MDETRPTSDAASAAGVGVERSRRQNLGVAVLAGLVAAVIGAVLWAVLTVTTGYQIGFMAVGIGFLVGFAVRLGHGTTKVFGVLGGTLALLGCLLGNFLSWIGFLARNQEVSVFSVLSATDMSLLSAMIEAFGVMDLVFYGIAVYEGYRFSFAPAATAPAEEPPAA